jgi:hypothetical protein
MNRSLLNANHAMNMDILQEISQRESKQRLKQEKHKKRDGSK